MLMIGFVGVDPLVKSWGTDVVTSDRLSKTANGDDDVFAAVLEVLKPELDLVLRLMPSAKDIYDLVVC